MQSRSVQLLALSLLANTQFSSAADEIVECSADDNSVIIRLESGEQERGPFSATYPGCIGHWKGTPPPFTDMPFCAETAAGIKVCAATNQCITKLIDGLNEFTRCVAGEPPAEKHDNPCKDGEVQVRAIKVPFQLGSVSGPIDATLRLSSKLDEENDLRIVQEETEIDFNQINLTNAITQYVLEQMYGLIDAAASCQIRPDDPSVKTEVDSAAHINTAVSERINFFACQRVEYPCAGTLNINDAIRKCENSFEEPLGHIDFSATMSLSFASVNHVPQFIASTSTSYSPDPQLETKLRILGFGSDIWVDKLHHALDGVSGAFGQTFSLDSVNEAIAKGLKNDKNYHPVVTNAYTRLQTFRDGSRVSVPLPQDKLTLRLIIDRQAELPPGSACIILNSPQNIFTNGDDDF